MHSLTALPGSPRSTLQASSAATSYKHNTVTIISLHTVQLDQWRHAGGGTGGNCPTPPKFWAVGKLTKIFFKLENLRPKKCKIKGRKTRYLEKNLGAKLAL